jgi:hypothetical protein
MPSDKGAEAIGNPLTNLCYLQRLPIPSETVTLSWGGVRLSVNWVNTEWDSTSTESTRSETPCQLSQHRRHQHIRRFYHSVFTQLMWSLTPCWLSWWRVWLRVDLVWERWIKPKQAYITSSGTFEGIRFRTLTMKCSNGAISTRNCKFLYSQVNWVYAEDTNIYEDFIILRWLSWQGVSLHIDSVDVESHLALTQLSKNETPRQLNHRRMLKNLNKSMNSRTKSKTLRSLII